MREAKQRGYTEPDPRDDLSGTDVARKLIILGREMGLPLEMSDVEIASLVPEDLVAGSSEEFLAGLSRHDAPMKQRFEEARARGKVLRYVGAVAADGRGDRRPGRARGAARVRQHRADRQRGALRHARATATIR